MADPQLPPMAPVPAHEQAPLPVNYDALYQMSVSDDPRLQQIAQQITRSPKFTPDHQKEWFDFQMQKHTPEQQLGIGRPDEAQGEALSLITSPSVAMAAGKGVKAAIGAIPSQAKDFAKIAGGASALHMMGLPPWLIMAMPFMKGGAAGKKLMESLGVEDAGAEAGAGATTQTGLRTSPSFKVPAPSPALSDADYLAQTGRPRLGTPGAPAPVAPPVQASAPAPTDARMLAPESPYQLGAADRRIVPRQPGNPGDAIYENMRQKLATGQPTGSPQLRQVDDLKRAMDAEQATARTSVEPPAPAKPVGATFADRVRLRPVADSKTVLRPDATTEELAQEMAKKYGVKIKELKTVPTPSGDDPLAKALRQRKKIEDYYASKPKTP